METGSDYADKKATFMLLDDMSKIHLAECIKVAEAKSMAERTEIARMNPLYKAHIEALGEARKAYLLAEVKYTSMKALAEARKTETIAGMSEKKYIGMAEG